MSSENVASISKKLRVLALIDGFNMYHALMYFRGGKDDTERSKLQKYKWLCWKTLISRFLDDAKEEIARVIVFTSYPYWNLGKCQRQQTYLTALKYTGVEYILGEFKENWIECDATCKEAFNKPAEKQTDVNIAVSMIEFANEYDVLILVTADSDQVPAIRLLKKKYPEKVIYILPPAGRNSKELVRAAGKNSRKIMTEDDLEKSQLPNPVKATNSEGKELQIWKPPTW
jgi:hypothetical protein